MVYTFHRDCGWYPIEFNSDEEAVQHIAPNPGTLKVVNQTTSKLVFQSEKDTSGIIVITE